MCFKVVSKALGAVGKVVKEVATPLGLGGVVKTGTKVLKEVATPLGLGGLYKPISEGAGNKPKATPAPPPPAPVIESAPVVAPEVQQITDAQETIVDKIKKREKRRQSIQTVFAGQNNTPNLGVFNAKY